MPDPVATPPAPAGGDPTPPAPAAGTPPPAAPPAAPPAQAAPPAAPAATPPAPAAEGWADPKMPQGLQPNTKLNELMKSMHGKPFGTEQAQALTDYLIASEQESSTASEAAAQQRVTDFVAQLKAEAMSNSEIGGAKWNETQALVQKALGASQLIPKEAAEKLVRSNLIHDVDIQRALRNIGAAISEGNTGGKFGGLAPQKPFFDHPTSRAIHETAQRR